MKMNPRDGKVTYDKSLRPVRQPGQMGDWAALLAVALFVGLWLLWPQVPDEPTRRGMPDPSCAYGVLSPSSSAGNVLARVNGGPAGEDPDREFTRLPPVAVPEMPPPSPVLAPRLPPPAYTADGRDFPLPPILLPPPAFPFKRPVTTQTGLVVRVSESLRNAGFTFDPPASSNNTPFSVSASLVFNGDGLVESILIDGFDPVDATSDMARWEAALLLSHAAANATGSVVITQH